MTDDAFKAAEKRGYAKGYATGRKDRQDVRNEFWRAAYLAALPAFLDANCAWTQGDKKLTTLPDRVDLAKQAADGALEKAIWGGHV